MGEVKPFPIRARPRVVSATPEGAAQILFFLGVRYQRHDDNLGGLDDASSGRRRSGGTRAPRKKRA